MYNKRNSDFFIHLFAIDEGTGHLQRVYNIALYLENFYKKIYIYIYKKNKNNNLTKYIHKMKLKKKFKYIDYRKLKNKIKKNNIYFIIMDIRDNDPEEILNLYQDSTFYVLCLDNHYKKKIKHYRYWETLPHPNVSINIQNFFLNQFWNWELIRQLKYTPSKNMDIGLVYMGLVLNPYSDFLNNKENIRLIFEKSNIQNPEEIYWIGLENYYSYKKFYRILRYSSIVITYPGLLFYESILLKKKVIAYHFNSKIHKKILEQLTVYFKDYFKSKIYIQMQNKKFAFYYFDFSFFKKNFLNPVNIDYPFNLWTSYKNIKNWIEENIKKYNN